MNFKKILNKLLFIVLSFTIISIPLNGYAYSKKVIPGGETIGIDISSKGVFVVGFYNVNGKSPGVEAGFLIGDIITSVDDTSIETIDDLSKVIDKGKTLNITYQREGKPYETTLNLIYEDGSYKTGLYIKDRVVGIGTLTFIDPESNTYGALGHEIKESTSGRKFSLGDGTIYSSHVTSIVRSEINDPGEKNATFDDKIGTITKNEVTGIYGTITSINEKDLIDVAEIDEIKSGKAYIRTVIENQEIKEYEIDILRIYKEDESKNILFNVTDETLISKTGGIVQGMSGSPIIQNNKIIGAVNYVVLDDPLKGYGVFITNMLKDIES